MTRTDQDRIPEGEADRLREEVARLQAHVEALQAMADAHPALLWASDTTGMCTEFNRTWLAFRGRTLEQEHGNGWLQGVHPDDADRCMATYVDAFTRREAFEMEYRLQRHDGEYRWILDSGAPRHTTDGTFAGYIGTCVDITDRRRREEAMAIQAERDPLTGIGNRARLLHAVVDGLLVSGEGIGLVFADVDGLKGTNDRFGHAAGDMALVQLARALVAVSRPEDLPVRWGGDEFVVLCRGVASKGALDRIAERIRTSVTAAVDGETVGLTVGTAFAPPGTADLDDLLARADADMYARKRARSAGQASA